ncbi:MAG: sugar transferase, partial [Opitutaceae bacterium]|nr:sugar transferase [Verrucomicrobiales bacterium]
ELIRWGLQSEFGQSQLRRRLILVGTSYETARLRQEISRTAREGNEILCEVDLNDCTVEQLVELIHQQSPNGVIVNAKHNYFDQVEKAIQACEIEGVPVWLMADFFKTHISRAALDDFHGRPVLVFHTGPESSWQAFFKVLMDLIGSLALLALSIPILGVVSIAIKLTSPGPILFRQQRSGLNGRPFVMYKFRSMVTNAEQLQHELASMNEMSGPVFKVTNDPRITPIGKFLRKYSIDELPQLFNVLRGDMSLVGPRPLPVDEVKRFNDVAHRRRLSVKPGLTCKWQISGRNQVSNFEDWVRLDLEYIDDWSLWLDLKILLLTVPVVLMGKGAK